MEHPIHIPSTYNAFNCINWGRKPLSRFLQISQVGLFCFYILKGQHFKNCVTYFTCLRLRFLSSLITIQIALLIERRASQPTADLGFTYGSFNWWINNINIQRIIYFNNCSCSSELFFLANTFYERSGSRRLLIDKGLIKVIP